MKRNVLLLMMVLSMCAISVNAGTVAYWRFEEGPADAQMVKTAMGGTYEESTADSSGNGYDLSVWDMGGAGYAYRDRVAAGTFGGQTNNYSVQNTGGGPAMWTSTNDAINLIAPAAFTVEATFKLENGGYRTIVGRDSTGTNTEGDNPNASLAALYFQAMPDNRLAIKFCDVAGYWYEAVSEMNVFQSFDFPSDNRGDSVPWYSMAGVSDGSTLSLYLIEHGAGTGWQQIASTDMTTSGSTNTALTAGAGDGGDWDAGNFTVGRGLYGGGHGDRAWGLLDEIRISDSALTTSEFLVPEPATLALLGLGAMVLRRKK